MLEPLSINFVGPFSFIREDNLLFKAREAALGGVYFWAGSGNSIPGWIFYVGETGKSFGERHFEHLQRYLSGSYAVHDIEALLRGQRVDLWVGYGWKKGGWGQALSHLENLGSRSAMLKEFLEVTEVWLAPISHENPTCRKRIESGLLRVLRAQGGAIERLVYGNRSHWYADHDRLFLVSPTCSRSLHGFPIVPFEA